MLPVPCLFACRSFSSTAGRCQLNIQPTQPTMHSSPDREWKWSKILTTTTLHNRTLQKRLLERWRAMKNWEDQRGWPFGTRLPQGAPEALLFLFAKAAPSSSKIVHCQVRFKIYEQKYVSKDTSLRSKLLPLLFRAPTADIQKAATGRNACLHISTKISELRVPYLKRRRQKRDVSKDNEG